jgi:cytoskeleton protein RodZ
MEVSTREVADALNLPVHVIEALEADDYERLPPSVFTRGYLRSYARLLELSPEALLARYPEVTEEVDAVTGELPVTEVPAEAPTRTLAIAAAVGAVLIALLVVLLGDDESPEQAEEVTAADVQDGPGALEGLPATGEVAADEAVDAVRQVEPAEEPAAAEEELIAAEEELIAAEEEPIAPVQPRQTAEAEPAPTAPAETAEEVEELEDLEVVEERPPSAPATPGEDAPEGPEAVESEPAIATREAAVQPVLEPVATDQRLTQQQPAATATPTYRERRITEFGDDKITFVFSEDCWVEVKSTDGENLYSDLNRTGRTLVLTGRAPFQVLLGYAPGVTLSFNDEPVALERYSRNNVANLVLGE